MSARGTWMGTLAIVAVLAAAAGACKSRAGALPALWEPIDPDFKGCEGG